MPRVADANQPATEEQPTDRSAGATRPLVPWPFPGLGDSCGLATGGPSNTGTKAATGTPPMCLSASSSPPSPLASDIHAGSPPEEPSNSGAARNSGPGRCPSLSARGSPLGPTSLRRQASRDFSSRSHHSQDRNLPRLDQPCTKHGSEPSHNERHNETRRSHWLRRSEAI